MKNKVPAQLIGFPGDLQNFTQFLDICEARNCDKIACSIFDGTRWRKMTYTDLNQISRRIGNQLVQAGLHKGDRVALFGPASLEWIATFFAILRQGGIATPIDIKLTQTEIAPIIQHCEPTFILADQSLRESARELRHLPSQTAKVLILQDLWKQEDLESFRPRNNQSEVVTGKDVAVLCYTSGTDGASKGVEIRTETLLFQADALAHVTVELDEFETMLSTLPLNHLYGLSGGLLYSLRCGMEVCFAHELSPKAIAFCLKERDITQILAVPLYFRLVRNEIANQVRDRKGSLGEKFVRILMLTTRIFPWRWYKKILFSKIRTGFGKHVKRLVCGGAVLDPSVYDFFLAIGIPVFVGYGLTETGPVIAVNVQKQDRRGSVGRPLPGVELRIERDSQEDSVGEILTRGTHVTAGYYKRPELTADLLTADGWLRTGDLGYVDKDGYLFVTGRRKSMIVLSNGKKVQPEELETVIGQSPRVRLVCVVGMKSDAMDEAVTAVIFPTQAELDRVAGDLSTLQKELEAEVGNLCRELAPFKRPSRVIVRSQPFVMTTTMKIKRDVLIEELSQGSPA